MPCQVSLSCCEVHPLRGLRAPEFTTLPTECCCSWPTRRQNAKKAREQRVQDRAEVRSMLSCQRLLLGTTVVQLLLQQAQGRGCEVQVGSGSMGWGRVSMLSWFKGATGGCGRAVGGG